jgi:HAD superfamily hydrolase (TIGR01450 family)
MDERAGSAGVAVDRFPIDLRAGHGVSGFMFDVDGTLAHRDGSSRAHPQPGALEVLDRIRSSGRKLALFTNASHIPSAGVAAGLRRDGFPVSDAELLTPIDSATAYLLKHHAGEPVQLFASEAVSEWMAERGVKLATGTEARAVFVGHLQQVDLDEIERAARAIDNGARLLSASYVRGYAALHGMTYSRGAMITAAIAKAGGVRPKIVGKPSAAAVAALSERLGVRAKEICVIGDDHRMDIALGNIGGSRTVLVRSGIAGNISREDLRGRQRPDAVIDGVAEILPYL